jgi:hypothetical protein
MPLDTCLRRKAGQSKIVVPRPVRDFGARFDPDSLLVQIVETDSAVMHPVNQMFTNRSAEIATMYRASWVRSRHYFTEDEATPLVSELLGLFGILRCAEVFREFKEGLLFSLLTSIPNSIHSTRTPVVA